MENLPYGRMTATVFPPSVRIRTHMPNGAGYVYVFPTRVDYSNWCLGLDNKSILLWMKGGEYMVDAVWDYTPNERYGDEIGQFALRMYRTPQTHILDDGRIISYIGWAIPQKYYTVL